MKIGLDISQMAYTGTGTARYTQQLFLGLLELGHTVHVFGGALQRMPTLRNQVHLLIPRPGQTEVHLYPLPPRILDILWNRLHILKIDRLIGDVDVFHTSDWTEPPANMPKVTTIHDLIVYKFPQFLPEEIVQTQKRKMQWVVKESAAIIVDSLATKKDVMHYLNVNENKITVIPLGIDARFFDLNQRKIAQIKERYSLRKPYFLCVGTQEPRKNLLKVVDAFSKLGRDEVELVIVGNKGWGQELPLQKNVRMLGYIPDEDLPSLYSNSIAFVYPSLYEGFGLPVLEALASKTLVITSDRGSLGELKNDASFQVNPESVSDIVDAMRDVITIKSHERAAKIAAGVRFASAYSWLNTVEKTIAVYKKIIKHT